MAGNRTNLFSQKLDPNYPSHEEIQKRKAIVAKALAVKEKEEAKTNSLPRP